MNTDTRRALIIAALGAAALALLWWAVIGNPQQQAKKAATAKVGQVVAEKRGEGAVDAGRIIERHSERITHTKEILHDGLAQIAAAPTDAAAGAAARRALCLLDPASYAQHPACQLQPADSARDAGAGDGQPVSRR
jgi:hypothetical protein